MLFFLAEGSKGDPAGLSAQAGRLPGPARPPGLAVVSAERGSDSPEVGCGPEGQGSCPKRVASLAGVPLRTQRALGIFSGTCVS